MNRTLSILILLIVQSNISSGQEQTGFDFERDPINVEYEEPKGNERYFERNERNIDRNELQQQRQQQLEERKRREEELKRINEERERELKILNAQHRIFEVLTYTPRHNLIREKAILSKFENLNLTHIQVVTDYLTKLRLKRELLDDIQKEINLLKKDINNINLKNRGDIAIIISSMCDKLIDLFAFSSEYTESGVAASRIKFINDILKEYIKNENLTVQWVFDQVYTYSSSNYFNNTQKSLMKSIEGLYSISKLMRDLEENKNNFKTLQKQIKGQLKRLEKTYLKYYEEYQSLQEEFLKIPNFDIYLQKNINVAKSRIELCEIQIEEIRNQIN